MSRPIWTGFISFGLVSIPVELTMAVHEKTVHFHMLSKDGHCRLRRKLVCPDTGKEYDFSDTARGIEVAPNEYVIVDQREINRLKPEKGRMLEIVQFVRRADVDPLFLDRVYYLKPAKDAQKPYKLLLDAMLKSDQYAIAKFVMRDRQYICVLRPREDGIILHTMHYADEVDPVDESIQKSIDKVKITTPELAMASELIKAMTKPLHIDDFKDDYRLELQKLIEAKSHGKPLAEVPEEEHHMHKTINLMDALKKSLAGATSPPKSNTHAHRRSA